MTTLVAMTCIVHGVMDDCTTDEALNLLPRTTASSSVATAGAAFVKKETANDQKPLIPITVQAAPNTSAKAAA